MKSIKDKIAQMIELADGKLVTHYHAVQAGILVEDTKANSYNLKKSSRK